MSGKKGLFGFMVHPSQLARELYPVANDTEQAEALRTKGVRLMVSAGLGFLASSAFVVTGFVEGSPSWLVGVGVEGLCIDAVVYVGTALAATLAHSLENGDGPSVCPNYTVPPTGPPAIERLP